MVYFELFNKYSDMIYYLTFLLGITNVSYNFFEYLSYSHKYDSSQLFKLEETILTRLNIIDTKINTLLEKHMNESENESDNENESESENENESDNDNENESENDNEKKSNNENENEINDEDLENICVENTNLIDDYYNNLTPYKSSFSGMFKNWYYTN